MKSLQLFKCCLNFAKHLNAVRRNWPFKKLVGGPLYPDLIPSITTYSKTTCAVVKKSKRLSSPVYKFSICAGWYFPVGRLVSLTSVKASVSVTSSLNEINWLWSLWGSLLLLQTWGLIGRAPVSLGKIFLCAFVSVCSPDPRKSVLLWPERLLQCE